MSLNFYKAGVDFVAGDKPMILSAFMDCWI
jgi:hypothetical protein